MYADYWFIEDQDNGDAWGVRQIAYSRDGIRRFSSERVTNQWNYDHLQTGDSIRCLADETSSGKFSRL